MILYIVRHGESIGNISGDIQTDPVLSPLGEKQVELLGKRFAKISLKAVISSPLQRAMQTADAVIRHQPKDGASKITVFPQLMEIGTPPDYEGLPLDTFLSKFVNADSFTPQSLGEENNKKAFERAEDIIQKISGEFSQGECVLIAAHGSFNQLLIAAALGFEKQCDFVLCQLNTSVTKITFNENDAKRRLTYMDDVSHLLPDYPDLFRNI